MNTALRGIFCVILAAIALTMVLFTLAGFDAPDTVYAASGGHQTLTTVQSDQYVLGEWEGYIAIFAGGETKIPLRVTTIELKNLREADRSLIREGLIVATETELMELLEDLGS